MEWAKDEEASFETRFAWEHGGFLDDFTSKVWEHIELNMVENFEEKTPKRPILSNEGSFERSPTKCIRAPKS